MRRALGIGAAVLVVVLLAWWLRRADRATPAQASRPAREVPAEPGRPVRPPDRQTTTADARAAGAPRVIDANPGTKERDPGPAAIKPLAETAAEAEPRLRAAAAVCVPDDGASGQSITFRYTLAIAGGIARIDDVTVVASELSDADVEDCVVGAIGEVTWEVPGAADARLGVQDSLRLADLPPP